MLLACANCLCYLPVLNCLLLFSWCTWSRSEIHLVRAKDWSNANGYEQAPNDESGMCVVKMVFTIGSLVPRLLTPSLPSSLRVSSHALTRSHTLVLARTFTRTRAPAYQPTHTHRFEIAFAPLTYHSVYPPHACSSPLSCIHHTHAPTT
jgi:hypothetical protein